MSRVKKFSILEEDFENQDPFLFLTNGIIPKSETHSRYLRIIQNFILGKGPDLKSCVEI
jgi:hypothetical protein